MIEGTRAGDRQADVGIGTALEMQARVVEGDVAIAGRHRGVFVPAHLAHRGVETRIVETPR